MVIDYQGNQRKKEREKERGRNKKEGKKSGRIREIKGKYKKQVASSAVAPMPLIPLKYQPALMPQRADNKLCHLGNVNLGNSFENTPPSFFLVLIKQSFVPVQAFLSSLCPLLVE